MSLQDLKGTTFVQFRPHTRTQAECQISGSLERKSKRKSSRWNWLLSTLSFVQQQICKIPNCPIGNLQFWEAKPQERVAADKQAVTLVICYDGGADLAQMSAFIHSLWCVSDIVGWTLCVFFEMFWSCMWCFWVKFCMNLPLSVLYLTPWGCNLV